MDTIPCRPEFEQLAPATPLEIGFSSEIATAWWAGQRLSIGRVIAAYQQGYDTVLLNAPPGSGKTLVAASVGRVLDIQSITCTHTLALQEQYLRTAPFAVTMKGKNNYPCGIPDQEGAAKVRTTLKRELTADDCDEYLECGNPWKRGCPYFAAIGAASDSNSAILNYSYAIRIASSKYLKRGVCEGEEDEAQPNPFLRELAVLDEGHLANDAIVDACSIELWHSTMRKLGFKWLALADSAAWKLWAKQQLGALNSNELYEIPSGDIILAARARQLRSRLAELAAIEPQDWIVRHFDNHITIQPIWARAVKGRFIDKYNKLLIMSATLGDPELLSSKLGLGERRVAYVDVPSTFPLVNRPTFYWPVAKLSSKSEEGDYAAIASAIKFIANQTNLKERKGIVHTGSYKLVRRLAPYLRDDPRFLLHESAVTREALVTLFTREQYPYVIVTPSLSTGFDLVYEIGFQVIAKVPFADLGDSLVRARREYELPEDAKFGKRSYSDDALNQVIQAVGRAVRAPDDSGVSYILDQNFWPLYKNGYSAESFKETLRWIN